MTDRNPLGRHVTPALSEARLARQYARIEARLPARRERRRWLAGVAFAAALVIGIALFTRSRAPATIASLEGLALEAHSGGQILSMPDGTRIEAWPESRLRLDVARPEEVRVALERGRIDLDVAHVDGRRFVVVAARHEVVVVGTRFHVRVRDASDGSGPALEVGVERGRVRVRAIGATDPAREVGAGETWSIGGAEPPAAPASAPPVTASSADPLPEPSTNVGARAPRAADGPRALLARAEAARSAGKPRDAAAAFDELRTKHRDDPRAGLAAFELGRLRMDALGDPVGAAEAFGDAIALAPAAPFREDAEARRVEAFDAMGNAARCRDAKQAYLARYPQGVHRAALARRCP